MSADYVRRTYGVDYKRGDRVLVDGRPGFIVSFPSQYLGVRFDGDSRTSRCHPTWRVERAELLTCNGCGHIHTPSGCAGDPTPSDVWAGVSVSACDCMELRDCWGCGEEYDANDADEAGQCLHAWYCRPCWAACDRGRSCRDGCHERGQR